MDIKDQLKALSERIERLKDQINTEEATKNAFIMPFIQLLGYDVFNPLEVIPEYISDVGIKKGEKVDYAITKDGQPIILIECKHWTGNLNVHSSQLLRYFHTSKAKFAILTNGIFYRFFTDLENTNKMDEKPFLEVNMLDIRENQFEEIKKFHKSYFDVENIINTASDLKYTNELKALIIGEMASPSEPFAKHFAKQIYSGVITARILEQFIALTKRSFTQVINELITDRLKSALNKEQENEMKKDEGEANDNKDKADDKANKIVTTEEEIESYFIVKSILRTIIGSDRIAYRDAQTYFSVLLDDNNRKPVCRLYLEGKKKMIGVFDAEKKEIRHELASIDEIYLYENQMKEVVRFYEVK